jgi:hypothetical protein
VGEHLRQLVVAGKIVVPGTLEELAAFVPPADAIPAELLGEKPAP